MDHSPYYSEKRRRAGTTEKTGKAGRIRHEAARSGYGAGATAWGGSSGDAGATALTMVAASVQSGVCPWQFMTSIDAGNRQLGNRAFLHWVGRLQAEGQFPDGIDMPLQMQSKKDKKNEDTRLKDVSEHGMPTLEAASLEMINPVANSDLSSPAGSSTDIQQAWQVLENEDTGSSDEISDVDSDSDYEDETDEFMANYFPAVNALYNGLTNRADHIQTSGHDALSLPGLGNSLATVMLGLLMIGVGLPLDLFTNLLGGIARCIMWLSDAFMGKPATWLLKLYFKHYPPSAADRARATSDELPRGPPRGIDWNVSVPELVAISGISGYLQAGSTQSSLSPRMWTQPWTGGRIASIVFRALVSNIVYLLQFTVFPQISRRILQNRLNWSATRSGLFVTMLYAVFSVVSSFILSYIANLPLAVYFVFQNLIEDNDLTPSEAMAAFIGYAALGMSIQITSDVMFRHFVVNSVNEENLVPWRKQFRAIPNRLVRTIAIALASFRNVVINVLSITLTTSQIGANIIGPLSTRFGQGGACFWPLAVAEVCGGLPAGFNQTEQDEIIATGEENLSFGQLFAIQLFPWLVGLIGLGIPIAYVISQYLRTRRSGRGANMPDPEEIGTGQHGDAGMMETDDPAVSVTSTVPGGSQLSVEVHDALSRFEVRDQSGARPAPTGLTAQMLFELLIRRDRLTPSELRQILREHVAGGDITEEEAMLIENMVREEVVLSKEK